MCFLSQHVQTNLHHHYGQAPSRNFGIQALTAARLLQERLFGVKTVTAAAVLCGVAPRYVKAALILLASEDEALIDAVMDGCVHILSAADMVKGRAYLLAAFRVASRDDCITAVRTLGVTAVFDNVIVPALAE